MMDSAVLLLLSAADRTGREWNADARWRAFGLVLE